MFYRSNNRIRIQRSCSSASGLVLECYSTTCLAEDKISHVRGKNGLLAHVEIGGAFFKIHRKSQVWCPPGETKLSKCYFNPEMYRLQNMT